jgi:hypothetical protein
MLQALLGGYPLRRHLHFGKQDVSRRAGVCVLMVYSPSSPMKSLASSLFRSALLLGLLTSCGGGGGGPTFLGGIYAGTLASPDSFGSDGHGGNCTYSELVQLLNLPLDASIEDSLTISYTVNQDGTRVVAASSKGHAYEGQTTGANSFETKSTIVDNASCSESGGLQVTSFVQAENITDSTATLTLTVTSVCGANTCEVTRNGSVTRRLS